MRQRIFIKTVSAAVSAVAALMCVAAQAPHGLVLALIASVVVVLFSAFGERASDGSVDMLVADLGDSHRVVEVAQPTSAFVSPSVIALPLERSTSRTAGRFALLFRDEIAGVKWRLLATRLRTQRGGDQAS